MDKAFFDSLEQLLSDSELTEAGEAKAQPKACDKSCDELLNQLKECRQSESDIRDKLRKRAIAEGKPVASLTLHPEWDEARARESTSAAFIQSLIASNNQ